ARLAALRSQLNPHFLFNALHSLAVLVRNDPAAAQVAIEQLGELLRYTLAETDADEVPLSEEWRFTKTYLDLEQIRFGPRRAVIADDEPLARQQLRDLLAHVSWIAVAGEAGDGASTVRTVNTLRPDLLFLDIQMPEGDGLEVLRNVVHRPHVIFTTAFDKYAVAAFEVQALDYLL